MKRIFAYLAIGALASTIAIAGVDMRTVNVDQINGIGSAYKTNDDDVVLNYFVEGFIVNAENTKPFSLSGATTPAAANGQYVSAGTYNGKPYYVNANSWYVWFDGANTNWITSTLGDKTFGWRAQTNGTDFSIISNYVAVATTGSVAVAASKSNASVAVYTVGNTGTGPSRLLYSNTNMTYNTYYSVRERCVSNDTSVIVGEYGKVALMGDRLRVVAGFGWSSNINISVKTFVTDHP